MKDFNFIDVCNISDLVEFFDFSNIVRFKLNKDLKFAPGAEGFLISLLNALERDLLCKEVIVYLSKDEINKHGLGEESILTSPFFMTLCTMDLEFLDRYGVNVSELILGKLSEIVDLDNGVKINNKSVTTFAFDPYYIHPPVFGLNSVDASESDIERYYSSYISENFIGGGQRVKRTSSVFSKINLYQILKEVWENSVHHAARLHDSFRFISLNKIVVNKVEDVLRLGGSKAMEDYLSSNFSLGNKMFVQFSLIDVGSGIYNELNRSNDAERITTVKSAFSEGITSKRERSDLKRGLGLSTAIECSKEVGALFVMTSSGVLVSNFDKGLGVVNDIFAIDLGGRFVDSSTSVTLIVPV